MVFSKSLLCALAMGVIPQVFASPVNLENELQARDGPSPIQINWQQYPDGYLHVPLVCGSQYDGVSVAWDTGSYLTWVAALNMTCSDGTNYCTSMGTFNTADSTTWVDLNKTWGSHYSGGSADYGELGHDNVTLIEPNGGVTILDYEFGVAYGGDMAGILGMALTLDPLPNYLPTMLKTQGKITKAAFSYWWDAPSTTVSGTGSFLLGGLDEAKYEGELIAEPLLTHPGGMKILLASVVVDGVSFPQTYADSTVDTGSPSLFLPKDLIANITTTLGGKVDSWDGHHFFVPCDQGTNKTIDFVWSKGAIIKVPLSTFLGNPWSPAGGLCPLQIFAADYHLIGVQVQQYAYWVYDQDDYSISIAKATFSTDSKIVNL